MDRSANPRSKPAGRSADSGNATRRIGNYGEPLPVATCSEGYGRPLMTEGVRNQSGCGIHGVLSTVILVCVAKRRDVDWLYPPQPGDAPRAPR